MEIIVVGAGAAGLAAANRLAEHGAGVTVLEARDRVGGRVWTLRPETLQVPVELGAEFQHGETPEIDAIADRARLRLLDVAGRRWVSARGRLRLMDDFWERLDRPMRRLRQDRKKDRSFADALAETTGVPAADRALATRYVEGFHAADIHRISERSLAEGGSPRGDVRERRLKRALEGYDRVITALAAPVLDRIRLGSIARIVRWRRGHVVVESHNQNGDPLPLATGDAVVVAVPLGVLQSRGTTSSIAFDPPIDDVMRHASRLILGHVRRVSLQFDDVFWASKAFARHAGDDRFDTMSFLQSLGDLAFPVWWTPYPVRAPLLVGWRGGPGAQNPPSASPDQTVRDAVHSLASILGMTPRSIQRRVVAAFTHDWTSDPFARGAYSYVGVGGSGASALLARPVQHTIFLAGEHADSEERHGTVHGAIASGQRAAERILRRRAARRRPA